MGAAAMLAALLLCPITATMREMETRCSAA
jgi:hypothetical protein